MKYPKRPKLEDEGHLEFIRKLPCLKCNHPPRNDPDHLRIGHNGGTGYGTGDNNTLPLCRKCHTERHTKGERTFYRDLEEANKLAKNLYLLSGHALEGKEQRDFYSAAMAIAVTRSKLWGNDART